MALADYKKKRSFGNTPEPGGKPARNGVDPSRLRFVIQKHDASHLHYDFRLEMEGVLKSWAVPKGPSTDPTIKRLAMMVEDHPFDYRDFEGIIPKGQYGGGTVIVWDQGFYEPLDSTGRSKADQDRDLRRQLHSGKLVFNLQGEKLKGEYALVKSSYQGENSWLLMKVKDRYAKTSDVTRKDKSVLTGRNIAQVEKEADKVWQSNRSPDKPSALKSKTSTAKKTVSTKTAVTKAPPKKTAVKKNVSAEVAANDIAAKKTGLKDSKSKKPEPLKGSRSAMPKDLSPMLATLTDKPFDDPDWIYEVKWDGYRAVAFLNRKTVELKSRNSKSFDDKFYPVHQALAGLGLNAILDGEVIAVNEEGLSNFGKLQNWRSEADGDLLFYVFDLLWLDGHSLVHLPLSERRARLIDLIPDHPVIRISQAFDATGTEFFEVARQMKLEGIMAKKADSDYKPGLRSREWLKIKINQRQEMVIGGYTRNDGTSKGFSALLAGVYDGKKLVYTGKIGTGFSDKLQTEMLKQFKPLETSTIPFAEEPDVNKPSRFRPNPPHATVTWLKPELVCEVSYTEMTSDGVMRHPSFEGMRTDKKASDVKAEKATPVKKLVKETKLHQQKIVSKHVAADRKTLLNPTDDSQERSINGHPLKFSNLNKIYWPKEKYTKRDLLNYYYQVAPVMLPYLKGRPESLNRYPNGIDGKSFYQKDVKGKAPDWAETFPYRSADEDVDKEFLLANNEAALLYMANLGSIEIHPWSSTIKKPDYPDWCAIDLDPDTNKFEQVIEVAQVTKQILDHAGADNYVKTSGSTGIHIYIPLGAKYTYEESKEFARVIVRIVQAELPRFTSIERATKLRKGKIYLDFLQNRPQATLAAPYSARPKPGATVSAPLMWDEVKKGLKLKDFDIFNMPARLKEVGDLFKPVLGKGINMKKVLKELQTLLPE